jgi:MFS family permease
VKTEQDASLYMDTFVTSLAEIPGLIVSAVLVERFGRKATMWCLLLTCCGFLGPLVLHQSELWTTGLLFGARACAMGSSTVLCLYAPEVYPTSVRSTGVGLATSVGKIGGIVCPLVAVGAAKLPSDGSHRCVWGGVMPRCNCLHALPCRDQGP